MELSKYLIRSKASIKEALQKLNELSGSLTLFVIDENGRLLGTLTDGDIRRGLVANKSLEDEVDKFMSENFVAITNNISVQKIKDYKQKGINILPVVNTKGEITKLYNLKKLNSILPVHAVIMAGGFGKRLKPLTDNVPKPMLQLGKKPIIEHNIDHLRNFGVENFHISVNYLADQIVDYFKDGSSKNIKIDYLYEDKPLGTIGSISLANKFSSDNILVINSDLFTNIDYEDLFLSFEMKNADMAIASIPYTVSIPYAIFDENESKISSFREKPNNTHYANGGIYLFKKELLSLIPKNEFFNTTDLLQAVLKRNLNVIHNPIVGYWIDIGRHEDYNKAKEIVKHL